MSLSCRKAGEGEGTTQEVQKRGEIFMGASGIDSGLIVMWLPSEAICSVCHQRLRPAQYTLRQTLSSAGQPNDRLDVIQ